MEFTQLIAQRYSCKNFGAGRVDAAALHTILEAGRLAPTAKNTQEQRIYVVQSEEGLAKIDAATPCRYGAPICLVVAYDKNHTFTYPGERMNSGMEDAAIVATHLLLGAANAGVDSCWVNFFDPDKLAKALGLPENEEIVMLLDLGHAAEGAGPAQPQLPQTSVRNRHVPVTITGMQKSPRTLVFRPTCGGLCFIPVFSSAGGRYPANPDLHAPDRG